MSSGPAELLSPLYYLNNFLTLLSSVEQQYKNLLRPEELEILTRFKSLTRPEQALLVRLYSRRGRLFRSDKVNYQELPDLDGLLSKLARLGFIHRNPVLNITDLLSLVNCQELWCWWPEQLASASRTYRKPELIEALSTLDNSAYYDRIPFTVIRIEYQAFIDLLLLLFFGHPNKDLSTFVTAELGHIQYENYPLTPDSRLFSQRIAIDHAQQLMQLRETFHQLDICHADIGQLLLAELPPITSSSPLKARHDRLCNRIGRALESCQVYALALQYYQKSARPPSRERQARILYKQKKYIQAAELCGDMLEQSLSEAETQFAHRFKTRCLKQAGHIIAPTKRFQPNTTTLELEKDEISKEKTVGIESVARRRVAESAGGNCFFVENWLFNAAFGLTFWQAIFSTVPGAFTHPFQSRPHDLYEPAFRTKRSHPITLALAQIGKQNWHDVLQQRWQQKFGISNPFVSWHPQGWTLLSLALARIPADDWRCIFLRMLNDLRENCCGFPDLIHFPENLGYRLLEVKSPSDKVQANQLRWMQTFEENSIPYTLLQVQWLPVK